MQQYILSLFFLALSACSMSVHDKELQDYNAAFSDWSADQTRVVSTALGDALQTERLIWQPLVNEDPMLRISFSEYDVTLSEVSKQALDALLSSNVWLSGHFVLKGYADEKGSRSADLLLAWKRSYIVGQYLEQFGIKHDMIVIQAYGKEMVSNPDKYAKLRSKSVEIFYEEGN